MVCHTCFLSSQVLHYMFTIEDLIIQIFNDYMFVRRLGLGNN